MTDIAYKAQARRLADHLSRVHGIKLKHASLLEAVAALHGHADWNTLLAAGPAAPIARSAVAADPLTPLTPVPRARRAGEPREAANSAGHDGLLHKYLAQLVAPGTTGMRLVPSGGGFDVYVQRDGVSELLVPGLADEASLLVAALKRRAGLPDNADGVVAEGQFLWRGAGAAWRLQVLLVHGGAASSTLVVRWTNPAAPVLPLDRLGMTRLADWRRGLAQQQGLCLVAGTTGSGCSTTLAASAQYLREQGREVREWVQMQEVRERYALPGANPGEVVLFGEIRDAGAARQAVRLAEQGHLVLASVHAGSIPRAIARLVDDLDLPAAALERFLRVALAQKLVRRVCRTCPARAPGAGSAHAACGACNGVGYAGREMVSECVVFDGRGVQAQLADVSRVGSLMLDDGVAKCLAGVTDVPELVRVFGAEAQQRMAPFLA